jgi:hypothetical protein
MTDVPASMRRRLGTDPEIVVATALLCGTLVVGFATLGDYGIAVDEWNADNYGVKALAWYTSGFNDRGMFNDVEETLWYYGPWFQILTALIQALDIAGHWTTRHAVTLVTGIVGIAMLVPLARRVAGPWAGLTAIILCLTTGYLYGNLFCTPIDIPFLFAMTAATLAIVIMAERTVPSWKATISAGLLTGLAIATRSSGIIMQSYLVGAVALCAFEAVLSKQTLASRALAQIGVRAAAALLLAWAAAFALWPWLHVGNPFRQFVLAFAYFASHPASFTFAHWGEVLSTQHLPWSYVPAQLGARLPEIFLVLLATGLLIGISKAFWFVKVCGKFPSDLKTLALLLAQSRQALVVWAAALLPIGFVMLKGSTLYDGVRHVLFVIPLLAVIASYGFTRLLPFLLRQPVLTAAGIGAFAGYQLYMLAALHPLEYIAFNTVAGGVQGAYGRFDMDYWALAAPVALRRLEDRLDLEVPNPFSDKPPSLVICIRWREAMVQPMYRRPWRLETDPDKADFLIATERMRCGEGRPVVLIDEVKRFDRPFAWTYARAPQEVPRSATAGHQGQLPSRPHAE